jgi:copper/silver efflux system protein
MAQDQDQAARPQGSSASQRLRKNRLLRAQSLASLSGSASEPKVEHDEAEVMKPIAAPIVGSIITSTIHVLILIPVFLALMKERAASHLAPTATV